MDIVHDYAVQVEWTGNRGAGTSTYRAYGREHLVSAAGKHDIEGSADPAFRGNPERWNPEELLLAALSQCHMLSYLHAAAQHGVTVLSYTDAATGTMEQTRDGGGHFTAALLRPRVTIADAAQIELAQSLHAQAAAQCFIASSVNFPVGHAPETLVGATVADATVADATVADATVADATVAGATVAGATVADATVSGATVSGATVADATVAGAAVAGGPQTDAE